MIQIYHQLLRLHAHVYRLHRGKVKKKKAWKMEYQIKHNIWALFSLCSMRVHNPQQICEILTLTRGPFYSLVSADLKPMQNTERKCVWGVWVNYY